MTLRDLLTRDRILLAPGAYDALTARLIEASGFEAVYLSGAGVSYSTLAKPDVGLITQTEMVERLAQLAAAVTIPIIADGDTGYGNAINVTRTVQLYERAGAAAIQLEDQDFPKRCGHLGGKTLIPAAEMVGRLRAARHARTSGNFLIIARTDARSVQGLAAAVERGRRYVEAGADMLFVESPESEDELRQIADAFPGVPLVANMVEGGKTPLLTAAKLHAVGYALVIFPNSLTRRLAHAALSFLAELRASGTTRGMLDQMMLFGDLNRLLGLEDVHTLEREFLPAPDEVTR